MSSVEMGVEGLDGYTIFFGRASTKENKYWSFGRYGKDRLLSTAEADGITTYTENKNAMLARYKEMGGYEGYIVDNFAMKKVHIDLKNKLAGMDFTGSHLTSSHPSVGDQTGFPCRISRFFAGTGLKATGESSSVRPSR